MKKRLLIPVIITIALITIYVGAGTALINFSAVEYPKQDSIFLKTHWQQMGGFERNTPDHMRLGCWSTALAQIMYYHQLKPFGHIEYQSSRGFAINVHMDSSVVDFSKLSPQIDSITPEVNIKALALYNYYAALTVNKDFGTDSYMHKLAPVSLLESHYKVDANRYISWKGILPYSHGKLKNIIMGEISQKRPLFLHFTNLKNFGHSVVVDGYKQIDDKFLVHLNQGQGGPQDGWCDFDKDLLKAGDHNLRVIYTFKPLKK
ncbi:MAG TPA: C10 family peptidase [Mucilaginibacter sp.]|jgi:hypothetical protein